MTARVCLICGNAIAQSQRWGTWNRFCSRSCAGKYAANHLKATASSAQRAAWGREGARARTVRIHEDVIERFEKHGRQGYWLAYTAGRHALKKARLRAKEKASAA